jgi:hypothetical protein
MPASERGDTDALPKPRQERDWLTPDEFRRLLDALGRPERNLAGLAERDRLKALEARSGAQSASDDSSARPA